MLRPALAGAPAMTILGEMLLGLGLVLPRPRASRRVSVVLAALLHYAIAITPYPNQVANFGVTESACASTYFSESSGSRSHLGI